jgi:hypothetical protein
MFGVFIKVMINGNNIYKYEDDCCAMTGNGDGCNEHVKADIINREVVRCRDHLRAIGVVIDDMGKFGGLVGGRIYVDRDVAIGMMKHCDRANISEENVPGIGFYYRLLSIAKNGPGVGSGCSGRIELIQGSTEAYHDRLTSQR